MTAVASLGPWEQKKGQCNAQRVNQPGEGRSSREVFRVGGRDLS